MPSLGTPWTFPPDEFADLEGPRGGGLQNLDLVAVHVGHPHVRADFAERHVRVVHEDRLEALLEGLLKLRPAPGVGEVQLLAVPVVALAARADEEVV
jgi:hypothetical protein